MVHFLEPIPPQDGLSTAEVQELQKQNGFNELPIKDSRGVFRIFIQIISEPMFSLLLVAGFVYLLIGSLEDAVMLTAFIAAST